MKKLKTIIANLDKEDNNSLSGYLTQHDMIEVLDHIDNPSVIDAAVKKLNPDILFLDIVNHGDSGIELLKQLRARNLNLSIVLVTSHQHYVAEVLNYQVFYCLYKPINKEELFEMVDKLATHRNFDKEVKIKLPVKNGFVYLEFEEILMLEAEGNYTKIITTDKEVFISSYNMGRLYKKLNPSRFFRVNRGCILNGLFLKKIDKRNKIGTVSHNGAEFTLPLSSTFITMFNKMNN